MYLHLRDGVRRDASGKVRHLVVRVGTPAQRGAERGAGKEGEWHERAHLCAISILGNECAVPSSVASCVERLRRQTRDGINSIAGIDVGLIDSFLRVCPCVTASSISIPPSPSPHKTSLVSGGYRHLGSCIYGVSLIMQRGIVVVRCSMNPT
jgi:hypothetical protein